MCPFEAGQNCSDAGFPEGVYLRADVTGLDLEVTPFQTIPHSFWWVMTTVTTVGYGDLYPTSVPGKMVGALTMLSGILALALPITIIGSNFEMEYNLEKSKREQEIAEREQRNAEKKRGSLASASMMSQLGGKIGSGAAAAMGGMSRKAGRRANAHAAAANTSPTPSTDREQLKQPGSDGFGLADVGDAALALEQCIEEHSSRSAVLLGEVAKLSMAARDGQLTGELLDTFLLIALGCLRDSTSTQELRSKILEFASQLSNQLGD